MIRRYLLNIAIALDQGCNALLGGNPDETISSRVGRAAMNDRAFAAEAEWLVDAMFRLLGDGPGHCRRNIEWDEING